MTRAWAWGLNVVAVVGLIAVCARSVGAESHVEPAASRDPACIAGPDYSAAVCDAASAGIDAPVVTAGRDLAPASASMAAPTANPIIASAETTALPAPAKAPFSVASAPTTEAEPQPGERMASKARALTEQAAQSTGVAAMDFRRQVASFTREQVLYTRHRATQDLAHRLGLARDLTDRARLYMFAGGGTSVVGYNVTGDHGAVTTAGWTMEHTIANGNTAQMGMAWKRGGLGVALVGVQRKLAQFGASVHDSVVAFKLSWSPMAHHSPPSS
jgi:hypothetical protein